MGFEVNDFIDRKIAGMGMMLQFKTVPGLVGKAKNKQYWKDRSGHARQLINGGLDIGNHEFNLYLAHGTEYGGWLEEGTGIYGPTKRPIVPVKAKILSWLDEDGKRHYAKKVNGIKPRPALKDTLEENKESIMNQIENYWSE
ncbi:hypothetical protein [Clostridium sp. YIM B02555]|uniref:hypothetical protein n=1 Tax=Clostridium sp. YIM B02555 TaxID=2911968 RepID=UPI001EEF6FFA|nr:hypothetical protein [Clostridium sp. YIM B02555]